MMMGEKEQDRGAVSVQGATFEQGDPSTTRAAAFAAVLTRTLSAAGYQPRHLSVAARREGPGDVLHLHVLAEVPGISQADFEALSLATLNGVSARLGFPLEGDMVLDAQLGGAALAVAPASPPQPLAHEPEPPEETGKPAGQGPLVAKLAIGLLFGLILGVLGLPRLQLFSTSSPAVPAAAPTVAAPEILSVRDVSTPELANVKPPSAPTLAQTPAPTTGPSVVLAEHFAALPSKWPNDPNGPAWLADGEYRLFARDPGHFVSVGVPLPDVRRTLQVSGQFHKVNGPLGGGYGFIVRDQGTPADRDGHNQAGQYLVVEVGDRGDVGIWQRDQNRWIDIVPWTHSDAVHLDRAPNVLNVITDGAKLRFDVNGVQVADVTYDRLPPNGGVGVFAGGDLNQVALEWLRIESP